MIAHLTYQLIISLNLVENLEDSARSIFNWIANNKMQGNVTKCHVLWSTNEEFVNI